MTTTMKNPYGPKHFITEADVPCFMFNELFKGRHTLMSGLDYITTNSQYVISGDLYFELHDEDGFIGSYIIEKKHLHLIKDLAEQN